MCHTKMIVGLGNPGPQYQHTKHNVGFEVIDELILRIGIRKLTEKHRAVIASGQLDNYNVILVKPLTFVNGSGQAVAPLVADLNIPLMGLCAVYDDFHLNLGTLRIRRSGSDGGHKGMQSIIHHLGSRDFPRLRIGIGKPIGDTVNHVLSRFTQDERLAADESIILAADALHVFIVDGIEAAMNKYNARA